MDAAVHPHEVIDLSLDDDEEEEAIFHQYLRDGFPELEVLDGGGPMHGEAENGPYIDDSHPDFMDLTRIDLPEPEPAVNPHSQSFTDPAPAAATEVMDLDEEVAPAELFTAAACLQMIVGVFPDISVNYALQFITDRTQDATRTAQACQQIISDLLDAGPYPKEEEEGEASRKRKREPSLKAFEDDDGLDRNHEYTTDAVKLLQDEFLNVPVRHIEGRIHDHKTLFRAYGVIEEQVEQVRNSSVKRPFTPIAKARAKRGFEAELIRRGSQLPKELEAAKKKSKKTAAKRHKAQEDHKKEENNLRQAILSGDMQECPCCCDEIPLNRTVCCNGKTMHFFCKPCVKQYVETEMGSERCQPVCFADPDCGGTFTRTNLQECLGEQSFDRLEHMQQRKDLEIAGLDLDECPFCDFKQECPPIEEDSEFRCLHPKCGKTSCRLCNKLTHVPLSCEESKKDEKLTVRHIVEEAMTAALIRSCNNCKRPFIKEEGCNKMTCPNCRHLQCYVCSATITSYDHFKGHSGRGKCPLHDNIEIRHQEEVQKAADEAMAKVKAENPGLSDADLMVQVSDRVKQAEKQRMNAAQDGRMNIPHGMNGEVLPPHLLFGVPRRRHQAPHAAPAAPVAPLAPAAQNPYVAAAAQYPPFPLLPPVQDLPFPGFDQPPHIRQQLLLALPVVAIPPPPQDHVQLLPVGVVPLQAPQVPTQAQQQPYVPQWPAEQDQQDLQDPHPQQQFLRPGLENRHFYLPPERERLVRERRDHRARELREQRQRLQDQGVEPPPPPPPQQPAWFDLFRQPAQPAPGVPQPAEAPRPPVVANIPDPPPASTARAWNAFRDGINEVYVEEGNANNVRVDGGHVVGDALIRAARETEENERRRRAWRER